MLKLNIVCRIFLYFGLCIAFLGDDRIVVILLVGLKRNVIADNVVKLCIGILHQNIQHRHIVAEHFTGSDHTVRARAGKTYVEEFDAVVIRYGAIPILVLRVESSYSLDKREKLVVGEPAEADYGADEVLKSVKRKFTVAKARAKRLVAEYSAASVLKELRCAAKDNIKSGCASLKRVVEHGEYLFVVILAADAVRDLVKIYALVNEYDKSAVAHFL